MSERLATLLPERMREVVRAAEPSAFDRNVQSLLERVEYRRCDSGEDIEAIYALRYKAYRAYGLVDQMPDQMISDKMDDAPNSHRFGVFVDDKLMSSLRIHHISKAHPVGSAMSVFGDVLTPRLQAGETFINPSQFTADPEWTSVMRSLPYITLRLAVIANVHFKSTSCICVIRDEHTAFYRRIFGSVPVGEPRSYPPFTVPVMLYDSNCEANLSVTLKRFPFFQSTPVEQRMLFAKPGAGELAPLTIKPTAKYHYAAA